LDQYCICPNILLQRRWQKKTSNQKSNVSYNCESYFIDVGLRYENVAIVASLPFSLHHPLVQTNTCALFAFIFKWRKELQLPWKIIIWINAWNTNNATYLSKEITIFYCKLFQNLKVEKAWSFLVFLISSSHNYSSYIAF
jgi:hypothetical protein